MFESLPIWAFVGVTLPLVLTPGASTAVVLRNSIAGGTRAGLVTAVGINGGSFCYGVLSACGFALALRRWPSAWAVLRFAGLTYLAWLGVLSLRRAMDGRTASGLQAQGLEARAATPETPGTTWRHLYEGFVTNALNPAIATFYLVLLPQFIPREAPITRSVLILTAVHICLAATWHSVWAAAGGTLSRRLAGGRPRQVIEALSGVALLLLALKIALG